MESVPALNADRNVALELEITNITPPSFPSQSLPELFLPDADEVIQHFPILDPATISYGQFFNNYIIKNRPCLFTKPLTSDWNVMRHWITMKNENEPEINFEFLSRNYGNIMISVTDCKESDYENPKCESMTVAQYITYWTKYREDGYPDSEPCLYLKDWHLMKNRNNLGSENSIGDNTNIDEAETMRQPYITPLYFASDWLNEASTGSDDDFRFAYMGPKGSSTPFHADVYGSFSWSANVIGTKKWLIYPPGKENMFRKKNGKIHYNYDSPGRKNIDFYEVIQKSGEVIFVPSGWHHAVWNLEDTISINHNWINGANIGYIFANLKAALKDVMHELDDLKDSEDFLQLCQQLLLANHGMNYQSFFDLLNTISSNRKRNFQYLPDYRIGSNHIDFDLKAISSIKSILLSEPEVKIIESGTDAMKLE